MNKLIAASAALLIVMAPTFAMAEKHTMSKISEEEDEVILIGPPVDNSAAIIAGGVGLIGLGLLLGNDGDSSTTTTTTGDSE